MRRAAVAREVRLTLDHVGRQLTCLAEVGQLDAVVAVDEEVEALDVAVDDGRLASVQEGHASAGIWWKIEKGRENQTSMPVR